MPRMVLWVDNDCRRYELLKDFMEPDDLVVFAWGVSQIYYYLNNFSLSLIIVDWNMEPLIGGTDVVEKFDFPKDRPIVCCSLREDKAREMADVLRRKGHDMVYVIPAKRGAHFEQVLSLVHSEGKEAMASWAMSLLPPGDRRR